jgi:hypothetical protein
MQKFWDDENYHKYINALYKSDNKPSWLYSYNPDVPESIRHITEYHDNIHISKLGKKYINLVPLFVTVPSYLYNYSIDDKSLQFYKELNFIDNEINYCYEKVNTISDKLINITYYDNLKNEIKNHGSIEKYLDNYGGEVNDLFWNDGKCETRWVKNMISTIKENNLELFVKKYDKDLTKFFSIDLSECEMKKILSNKNVDNDGHTINTFVNTFLSAQKYFQDRVGYIKTKLNQEKY